MAYISRKYYDVVVVGAGPAGANFCRILDGKKYSILLIDGSEGRDKVCGGLLSPDAQDLMAKYDINLPKSVMVSPQLFSVKTIDLFDGLTRYYRRSYMNIDRRKFDAFLVDMARGNAETVNGRCENIKREENGFSLDVCGEARERISCKYLIGADGATPVPVTEKINDHIVGLMRVVKTYEKYAVKAAITGDDDYAIKGLLVHPLVGDYEKTVKCFNELKEAHKEFLPQYFNK